MHADALRRWTRHLPFLVCVRKLVPLFFCRAKFHVVIMHLILTDTCTVQNWH